MNFFLKVNCLSIYVKIITGNLNKTLYSLCIRKGGNPSNSYLMIHYHIKKAGVIDMFISVDERAATWFSKEFDINKPLTIRMYPQYAGLGEKHKGYSLAFSAESPTNAGFTKEINGITFFIEGNDIWFFEDTKTYLSFNDDLDELQIAYQDELAIN